METRSQQAPLDIEARLDIQEKQIQGLQSSVAEIKSILHILEADRLEEREFRKEMLAWIQQQEKQPWGGTYGVLDSSALSSPSPMVLCEGGHDCSGKPPPSDNREEVSMVISESESKFKTTSQSFLPPLVPLTTTEAKGGKTMGLISNQEGREEKYENQNIIHLDRKNPDNWNMGAAISLPRSDYQIYLEDFTLGVERKEAEQALNPHCRPPPLPPPLPPLPPEIEERNGGTQERPMTEHRRSFWEKADLFNFRLEVGYLGYHQLGLKIDKWAKINSLGTQQLNQSMHLAIRVQEKESPLVIKCAKTEIPPLAKSPVPSSTICLRICNSKSILEIREEGTLKLAAVYYLCRVAMLYLQVGMVDNALHLFDKMFQQENLFPTGQFISQVFSLMIENEIHVDYFNRAFKVFVRKKGIRPGLKFFNLSLKTDSKGGHVNKAMNLMSQRKTRNNMHPNCDFYYIVLGGYVDSKKKSVIDTLLKQFKVKRHDLSNRLQGRNSRKKPALGSWSTKEVDPKLNLNHAPKENRNSKNAITASVNVSMMGQFGVGLFFTYLFAKKVFITTQFKDDVKQYVWDVHKIGGVFPVVRVETGVIKLDRVVTFDTFNLPTKVKSVEMHHVALLKAIPGNNVGFNVKNVAVKYLKYGYFASNSKEYPAQGGAIFTFHVIIIYYSSRMGNLYALGLDCLSSHIVMVIWVIHMIKNYQDQVGQWLIGWKGATSGDSMEKDVSVIKNQSYTTSLEDKTFFEGGSSDTDADIPISMGSKPRVLQDLSRGTTGVNWEFG